MKMKALSTAIIAASALVTSSAFALAPSAVTGHDTMDLWIGGASAEDKLIQDLFSELCDAGTLDYFTDTTGKTEGKSFNGARCTMTESASGVDFDNNGTLDGHQVDVFIRKRSSGGSTHGVVQVANNEADQYMDITEANCGGAADYNDANGNPVWVCDNTKLVDQIPTAGISDVEPALFAAGVNGGSTFDSSEFTSSSVQSVTSVTFGVIVTKNLRDALQAAEGKTVGSDLLQDMPSLSHEQIASIFNGNPYDWTNFKVLNTATNTYVPLTQIGTFGAGQTAGLTAPTSTKINLCTRTAGSGTRAQFNANFMNNPCDKTNQLSVPGDNTFADGTNGYPAANNGDPQTQAQTNAQTFAQGVPSVHENAGAGDVDVCMNNLNAGNNWGLGYQALEKSQDGYRFVAVDGYAPTLQNVAGGKYFDWVANSLQWRANTNPPSAGQINLLKAIAKGASNPVKLKISNDGFSTADHILNNDGTNTATAATSVGYMALSKNYTASIPFSVNNPVNPATHNGSTDSSTPASCRKPLFQQPIVLN